MRSQLTDASISNINGGNWVAEYTYHDNGDMSSRTIQSDNQTFSYTGHQMTNADGNSLSWDKNGNLTTGVSTNLVWNWDDKLRSATKAGTTINLKYDPSGNRIYKDSGGTGRKYIVDIVGDLPVILLELDVNNVIQKTYIYANSQIIAQHDGKYDQPRYFYLHDRLGSVRQLIDTNGAVVKYYTFEPFGQTLESGGTFNNSFMFTGQYRDSETGYDYLRARIYNPYIYRFTSRDPVLGEFKEPLTLHVYLYCINDPINRIDPFGLLYTDINLTGSFGIIPGVKYGGSLGWGLTGNPYALVGGMVVGGVAGGFGGTGGLMTDYDTGKAHFYGGIAWSSSLKGGIAVTPSLSLGNVTTGWHIAYSGNISRAYVQRGSTLFRDENIAFEEAGITIGGDFIGFGSSIFYVFPGISIPTGGARSSLVDPHDVTPEGLASYFGQLDLLSQAVLMSQMIQDTGQAISEGQAGIPFWTMAVTVARQYGM